MQTLITSWGIAVLAASILAVVWFIISILRKRNDVADIGWGTYFIAITLSVFWGAQPQIDLRIIPIALVVIWGIRLSWHIFKRHIHTTEDARYVLWRNAWGKGAYFYLRSLGQVFVFQGILATIIAFPVIIIVSSSQTIGMTWLVLGTVIWVVGFLYETVADNQLRTFITNPANKGRIMQTGLWNYSRHPNYFGEITQWWGLGIIALGVPFGIIGIVGPLVITFLIGYVSGVPLAEKGMVNNPEYQIYKSKTSALIPGVRWLK